MDHRTTQERERMTTKWGAWIQELAYLRPKYIRRYARQAEQLGMTAVAFDLLNHVQPSVGSRGSDDTQFQGNNISRPKAWFCKNLDEIVEEFLIQRGIKLTCYGYMTPDVRRWFDVARLNGGGSEFVRADWFTITPIFADGYRTFISTINQQIGSSTVSHVDAVEPHLLAGVEARIHDIASDAWPGCMVAGTDEKHINPGDPMIDYRYVAWDGWGSNTRAWKNDYEGEEIVRPFACLPGATGNRKAQIKTIKRYFRGGLREANRAGVERLFVLPTTNWLHSSHAESIDPDFEGWPGMPSLRLEPWWDLCKAMRKEDE